LRGDGCDRDVVDVDVLLADEVKQQVERPFIDVGDRDGKGIVALLFLLLQRRDELGPCLGLLCEF